MAVQRVDVSVRESGFGGDVSEDGRGTKWWMGEGVSGGIRRRRKKKKEEEGGGGRVDKEEEVANGGRERK